MKVRIKSLGKLSKKAYGGQQPDGALDVTPAAWGGGDYKSMSTPKAKIGKTLTSVPRDKANLEAEGGETAFGPISGDNIPDHFTISGPRHTNGGVPLDLPDDTFIFSDTKAMKIRDPKILKMFGKTKKKGGYTPAELAKPYDINKYKEILMDPDSDEKSRNTAEMMIKNYIMKLGALALAQEAKKGFPQGIPEMARPYMEANGITEEQLIPPEPEQEQQMMQQGPPPQQMPDGAPIAQPQPMPQQGMPPQGMMTYGGFSDLDRFVYAQEGLVVEGDQEGLITSPMDPSPWTTAFQNENAPDNPYLPKDETPKIEVDPRQQEEPLTNKQVAEGTGTGEETKAKFKLKNAYDVDLKELGRRTFNKYMPAATNIIKGLDASRIAGDDARANFDFDAVDRDERGETSALSGRQLDNMRSSGYQQEQIVQFGGVPMAREGMSATNPNMSESCPQGQGWNGILGKCQPIEELRMFYRMMRPGHPRRNAVFGELGQARMNADDSMFKLGNLFDGDAWMDTFYHVGSQISSEFGPDGYAYGKKRPKFSKEYIDPPKEQYGGTPMAAYGMTTGGSYFPSMGKGGTRKVKIKKLPKYEVAGTVMVNGEPMTPEQARAYYEKNKPGIDVGSTEGLEQAGFQDESGRDVYYSGETGEGRTIDKREASNNRAKDPNKFLDDMCQSMKTGSYVGVTAQELADKSVIGQEAVARLSECETGIESDSAKFVVAEEPPTPDMKCNCKDAEGNLLDPQPQPVEDPSTGEMKCPCPEYTDVESQQMQVPGFGDSPRWSDVATRGVYTAALMDPNVARAQVARPDRVEVRSGYEDYLAKQQAIASNVNMAADKISQTAQSTPQKMAQLSNLVGKATQALGKNVADVEARNVRTGNQTQALQSRYDAGNAAATADAATKQSFINASVRDKETLNWNAIRAQTQAKIQEAEAEKQKRALTNYLYPQYATDFAQGLPYFTTGKPQIPEKPALTPSEMMVSPELMGLSDEAKEAYILKSMPKRALGGFIPTYTTMPYGN